MTNGERERERTPHSLSLGGRDAAGSVTNDERERERPPEPCVRYSEERTNFSSIKIVLCSVYVPLSAITLFKINAAMRQVELCFVHAWYTTSLGKQPLQAFNLAHGLPFRKEMTSTMYPHGCGWARSVSTCTVHLFSSCIHTPPTWGCVREIQTLRDIVCGFLRVFFGGGGSIKKCNICNVCEIESWIYHIYIEGAIHEKRVEVSSA